MDLLLRLLVYCGHLITSELPNVVCFERTKRTAPRKSPDSGTGECSGIKRIPTYSFNKGVLISPNKTSHLVASTLPTHPNDFQGTLLPNFIMCQATTAVAVELLKLTADSADVFGPLKSAAGGALHIVQLVQV